MVKIYQTGLLKLNFETGPKNPFPGFCQKFRQAMDKVGNFFCQFPNPWALRVSGMGGYTSKCEIIQNHCTLLCIPPLEYVNQTLPSPQTWSIGAGLPYS